MLNRRKFLAATGISAAGAALASVPRLSSVAALPLAKPDSDNGVWLATTSEHHESLRRDFPQMRSIQVLGSGVTGWQVLPADEEDFEAAALRACELVLARDPRIGKVPGAKRSARKEKASKRAKKTIAKAKLRK
jgi:hypothetical protein